MRTNSAARRLRPEDSVCRGNLPIKIEFTNSADNPADEITNFNISEIMVNMAAMIPDDIFEYKYIEHNWVCSSSMSMQEIFNVTENWRMWAEKFVYTVGPAILGWKCSFPG